MMMRRRVGPLAFSLSWGLSSLSGCDDGTTPAGPEDPLKDASIEDDRRAPDVPILDMDTRRRGAFGEPCRENRECESGYCIDAIEAGRICTQLCGECPEGYECNGVENGGPDLLFICTTDRHDLCKPCLTDRECDDSEDRCLEVGNGHYCGEDCAVDGVCPSGYVCGNVSAPGGDEVIARQCRPIEGRCLPCLDADTDGYGDGGDCLDFDCDDADPAVYRGAPEVCDAKDNNCNALVDEPELLEVPGDLEPCLALGLCVGAHRGCVSGVWICGYPAGFSDGVEGACDGVDEDCDGRLDEDFDRQTDVNHCGVCGGRCAFPGTDAACLEGVCERGACHEGRHDIDGNAGNGCEYLCLVTLDGSERCDGLDNNCDGRVDEGFQGLEVCNGADDDCDGATDEGYDLLVDNEHCGRCDNACVGLNATGRCDAAVCRIGECDEGFLDLDGLGETGCEYGCFPTNLGVEACDVIDNDCDGRVDEGFDLGGDPGNCGACGRSCARDQVLVHCDSGRCASDGCVDGFVDLDGLPGNGCEFACARQNGGLETCNFQDDDCDGRTDEGTRNRCDGCGPEPAEVCDGLDNDCDGTGDNHGACGPYVQGACRVIVGWSDNDAGPGGAARDWGVCPGQESGDTGDVRCVSTRRDGLFAHLDLNGDVDDNDRLALAFQCDDGGNPGLAAYIDTHCAVYLGYADNNAGPEGTVSWGACPPSLNSDINGLRCTSSGYDRLFRKINLEGDVDSNDDFAVALKCSDPADPGRAAALQQSIDFFMGWADLNAGPPTGSISFGPCPGAVAGDVNGQRCTSSRGDGLFHRLDMNGNVNQDDDFGFALRARPAP